MALILHFYAGVEKLKLIFKFILLISLIILFVPGLAFGANKPLFGPEFTFMSEALIRAQNERQRIEAAFDLVMGLKAWYESHCSECNVEIVIGEMDGQRVIKHISVLVPDKFEIRYQYDKPAIEFNLTPLDTSRLSELKEEVDQFIFKSTEELGLFPHRDYGGGHVHMDLATSVGEDPILFRNLIVEYFNYSEVLVSLGAGPNNSPTLDMLTQQQLVDFRRTLKMIDQQLQNGSIQTKSPRELIVWMAKMIQENVYYATPSNKSPSWKYQALNLSRIADESIPWHLKTLEFRFFRAQRSIDEFIDITNLLNGRVVQLRGQSQLLPFQFVKADSDFSRQQNIITFAKSANFPLKKLLPMLHDQNLKTQMNCSALFIDEESLSKQNP